MMRRQSPKKTSKILENRKALSELLFVVFVWPSASFFHLREAALLGKLICMGCMRTEATQREGTTK